MLEQKQQQDKVYTDLRERMAQIRKRYEEEQQKMGAGNFVPVTYAQAKQSGVVEDDPEDDDAHLPEEANVAESLLGGKTQDTLITNEVSALFGSIIEIFLSVQGSEIAKRKTSLRRDRRRWSCERRRSKERIIAFELQSEALRLSKTRQLR